MRDQCLGTNGARSGAAHWRESLWPAAVGVLALAIGALVYVTERPAGHAALLPAWASATRVACFGAVGGWLPSFLHPFAFALLTAAALRTRRTAVGYAVCAGWALVNVVIECAQLPAAAAAVARAIDAAPTVAGSLQPLRRYVLAGTFDTADVVAALAGALAAAIVLRLSYRRGLRHVLA